MNTKTITLTHDDAVTLECFLLMTTSYRKGEVEAWEKLAEELDKNGKPLFPKAQSNAEWWRETSKTLEAIYETISNAPIDRG